MLFELSINQGIGDVGDGETPGFKRKKTGALIKKN